MLLNRNKWTDQKLRYRYLIYILSILKSKDLCVLRVRCTIEFCKISNLSSEDFDGSLQLPKYKIWIYLRNYPDLVVNFCVSSLVIQHAEECLSIYMDICGIAWPMGWVQRAKRIILITKQVILLCFWLCFIKMHHDMSSNASHSRCITASCVILWHSDVTSDITNHAHVAGHVTIWYKRGLHVVWGCSLIQDIWAVGSLEACTDSNASGASFNCTSHINLCYCRMHAVHCTCLGIPEKPRSATHSSTSTASAGLQCLLVGARVHMVWLELQVIPCGLCHMTMSSTHYMYIHTAWSQVYIPFYG